MAVTQKLLINYYQTSVGNPALGLSPTIRIWEVTPTSHILVVNNDPMIEIGDGFYKYHFTAYDSTKKFAIRADGGDIGGGGGGAGGSGLGAGRFAVAINNSFADDTAFANWEAAVADHLTDGTMGHWVRKKLLTVSKFLSLD